MGIVDIDGKANNLGLDIVAIDRKADKPSISTSIADIDGRADNPKKSTSTTDINRRTDNLGICIDVANKKTDKPGIDIIDINANK